MHDPNHATAERIGGPDRVPAEMLDIRSVAKFLGCSERHVARLVDAGKMPRSLRLGRLCRWPRAELQEWIAGGCEPVRRARGGAR